MPRPKKPASLFRYFNSSPEMIRLMVTMYVRFLLSLRDVEGLCQTNCTLTSEGYISGAVSLALVAGQVPGTAALGQNCTAQVEVNTASDRAGAVALTTPSFVTELNAPCCKRRRLGSIATTS
jgi:hypothetical protein